MTLRGCERIEIQINGKKKMQTDIYIENKTKYRQTKRNKDERHRDGMVDTNIQKTTQIVSKKPVERNKTEQYTKRVKETIKQTDTKQQTNREKYIEEDTFKQTERKKDKNVL